MGAKKDFSSANKAFDALAEAVQMPAPAEPEPDTRKDRKTYTEAEAAEFLAEGKTSGRKGVKLPRINVAFPPDLYDYIKVVARGSGMTFTDFINLVLRKYMEEHPEAYEKALEVRNTL